MAQPSDSLSAPSETGQTPNASSSPLVNVQVREADVGDDDDDEEEEVRPFPSALLLRLRVTQIVCGILATLLGTVACIEEKGEFGVGAGVVSGFLSVLAAGANIHASRHVSAEAIGWSCGPRFGHLKASLTLASLWLISFVSNVGLIVLVFLSVGADNSNLMILGTFEILLSVVVIGIVGAIMWITYQFEMNSKHLPT